MTTATLCIACRTRETDGGLQCAECLSRPRESAAPAERTHSPAEADVLERDVSADCDAYLELHGWTVYRIGISEAGRVYQTPGIPDRLVIHEATGRWAWVEYKRPHGGVQSEAQREFERQCGAMGWRYALASQISDVENLHRERGNG